MLEQAAEIDFGEQTPEQRLWMAVVARTVQEWVSGPKRLQRQAEDFLFNNHKDFDTVCCAAGLDPQRFRGKLQRFRVQVQPGVRGSAN